MGGPLKGNNGGGGHRVRPYGVMLLLAFVAALLGVLAIHKLREKRNFRLLVQEKDRQLISLQLLLQEEREHTKEMKRKNEELKTRLVSVDKDKAELSRRILELHSTIGSLRDEGRILDSAFQEKETEIRTLREKVADVRRDKAEIVALTAGLKQKDAVIEDLNRRLGNLVKTRPAGTEDSSDRILDASIGESKQEGNSSAQKMDRHDDPNPTRNHVSVNMGALDGNKEINSGQENPGRNGTADADERKVSRKSALANSNERVANGNDKDIIDVGTNNRRRHANVQSKVDVGTREQINTNPIINVSEAGKSEELQSDPSTNNRQVDSSSRKEEGNNQKEEGRDPQGRTSDRGVKLEMADTSRKLVSKRKGKPLLVRANGKRWKVLARNRRLRSSANQLNHEADGTGTKRASAEYQDTTLEETHEDEQTTDRVEVSLADRSNQSELKGQEDSTKSQLVEQQHPQNDPKDLVNDAPAMDVKDDLHKPVDNLSQPNLTNVPERMEIPQTYDKSEATINEISGIRASYYGDQGEYVDKEDKGQDIDVSNSKISLEEKNAGDEAEFGEKSQEEDLDRGRRTNAAAEDFQIEEVSTSKGGKDEEVGETDNIES